MLVSQKCRYALRAIFELARRHGQGPVKNSEIAAAQEIPVRFLEVILSQLKRGGFVSSKRGSAGGYVLAAPPESLTVGGIIRFVQGPFDPAAARGNGADTILRGERAFGGMWEKVRTAVSEVYDTTTFRELLEEDMRLSQEGFVPSYAI